MPDIRAFEKALARCREFGIDVEFIPCPETLYLGKDREPGTFLERLNSKDFFRLLDRLTDDVRNVIRTRGPPLCLIGVNSSPTCGVDTTYYGEDEKGPSRREGRGVFLARFFDLPAIDVTDFARYHIYLAAPLFSVAERRYNVYLKDLLTAHFFSVFLPQECGDEDSQRDEESQQKIFSRCCEEIANSDIVVAVIDGADADSGTSWEIGYAFARDIPVVALRTDFRRVGEHEHVNLMIERSSRIVRNEEELLQVLKSPRVRERVQPEFSS